MEADTIILIAALPVYALVMLGLAKYAQNLFYTAQEVKITGTTNGNSTSPATK
jgi:hypothetical protein